MKVNKWSSYFSVILPWIVVGMPIGLTIPILVPDIPVLDVPFYHKVVDVAVLSVVSLLLGAVFLAVDNKGGYVEALHKYSLTRRQEKERSVR